VQRIAVKEQAVARFHFGIHGFELLERLPDANRLRADLPGRISSSPLSGDGYYVAMFVRWQPTRAVLLSASYAATAYNDRTMIGEGSLQEIQGNVASTLALQADITFH